MELSREFIKNNAKEIFKKFTLLSIMGFIIYLLVTCITFNYDLVTNMYTMKIFFFTFAQLSFTNIGLVASIVFLVVIFFIKPILLGLKLFYFSLGKDKETSLVYIVSIFKSGYGRALMYIILKELIFLPAIIIMVIATSMFSTVLLISSIVIMFWLYLSISQADYIFFDCPNLSAWECIVRSMNIMVGRKAEYFILQLSFILWDILVVITLGIANIYVYPYKELTYAEYYRKIRDKY